MRRYILEAICHRENPDKKLPTTLLGLATILGCAKRKNELMKALGIKS